MSLDQEVQTILPHKPVMLHEVMNMLCTKDGETYLDCTFGAGGYSREIISSTNCKLFAIDRDPSVEIYAQELKNNYKDRFEFTESRFAEASSKFSNMRFDGIVMDLGVSSMQLDTANRGFSFSSDGPLDMRMGNDGMTVADFINNSHEEEIANVIYQYGDETRSRKISKKISEARAEAPIASTARLTSIIHSAVGSRSGKIDSATKTFQALRICVNNELEELRTFLENVNQILAINGRLVIVSFHSLEDRIIKQFFKNNSMHAVSRSKYAAKPLVDENKWLQIITKKPLIPSLAEVKMNPRARSAKLRVAQKIHDGLTV